MDNAEDYNKLDVDTSDIDVLDYDLENINVNVWFNKLESRLQYCLVKENAKEGFMQYKMLVFHAEVLAISGNKVEEEDYKEAIKKEIDSLDDTESEDVLEMRKAMIKYKVILKSLLTAKKGDLNLDY